MSLSLTLSAKLDESTDHDLNWPFISHHYREISNSRWLRVLKPGSTLAFDGGRTSRAIVERGRYQSTLWKILASFDLLIALRLSSAGIFPGMDLAALGV